MNRSVLRSLVLAVAIVGASAAAGGLLGSGALAEARPSDARLQNFAQVLALIEEHFIGEADEQDLVESAIMGMLHTLDPHSNYLDKHAFTEMQDEQRGRFYGLGIQINKPGPDKPLTIIAPIEGTPAYRSGLQAGDIIFKIEGQETSDLSLHEAVRRLKGDRGTPVTITIQRPTEETVFDVTLVRDEIPTSSIRAHYIVQPGTGYVRVSNFTSTTATELDEAMRSLSEQGMERLVLDLRSNPGGLLESAVEVSKRFIAPGQLLVFTRGRIRGSDQDYAADNGQERVNVPLVILLDRHSASASEIVAGAVQDHDRGLLVGERSFGKGLVQRVIPLRNGGAVALTTAKYYTPSGRLIQRDFSDLDGYFLDERREGQQGPIEVKPREPVEDEREIFYTDAGRVVYGGGGITPDYVVSSRSASALLSRLIRQNMIFDFAVGYAESHPELEESTVELDDDVLDGFLGFLESRAFQFSREAFENDREDILRQIRANVAKVVWGEVTESRVLAEGDAQLQKALTLFDEAASLAATGDGARRQRKASLGSRGSSL